MQHLQEQLQAQYSRQQQQQNQQGHAQQQQQQMMFSGMTSALNNPMAADHTQQAQLNANQNQQQWNLAQQQGLGDQTNNLNSTALAMMQQQQQQQMSGMNTNNSAAWLNLGGLQTTQGMSQAAAASMDASSSSSAQLAAFVGMGMGSMGGNSNSNVGGSSGKGSGLMETSNIQAFLQQQQAQQQQQQQGNMNSVGGVSSGGMSRGMAGNHMVQQSGQQHSLQSMGQQQLNNSNHGLGSGQMGNTNVSGGNANAQMMLQQQLAKLQRQFQGQQDQQGMGGSSSSMDSSSARNSETTNTLLQTQQQLMQQMRQQRSNSTNANSFQQLQQQQQQGSASSLHQGQQRGQRNSATGLQQQINQQGTALTRLQQINAPSNQQNRQVSRGLSRGVSNSGIQGDTSATNLQNVGSDNQIPRDASNASVARDSSSLDLQGGQQQVNANQNWMAPLNAVGRQGSNQSARGNIGVQQQQNQQTSRALAAMQNQFQNQQAFQNQSASGMNVQQRLSNSLGVGGNTGNFGVNSQTGLSDQDLLMQQSQLLRSGNLQQGLLQDNQKQTDALLMGQAANSNNTNLSQGMQMNSLSPQNQLNFPSMVSGVGDASGLQNTQQNHQSGGMHVSVAGSNSLENNADVSSSQKSFLDGNFAGGWQSNADLPDRRHIIFSILEVIKQMRPDTNKISQKLPHMAKSLEEHLYRSAQTKEDYLDLTTLKNRLQMIAHGLEYHKTRKGNDSLGQAQNVQPQQQQQAQFLQQMSGQNSRMQPNQIAGGQGNVGQGNVGQGNVGQGNIGLGNVGLGNVGLGNVGLGNVNQGNMVQGNMGQGNMGDGNNQNVGSMANQNQSLGMNSSLFGGTDALSVNSGINGALNNDSGKYQDPIAAQKKKVIRQQQQRLLLLRHASKCDIGPSCKTKFCAQMVTLWKHMKRCRDKNCTTSHCLSSRCVLNHYRICKSQGRTSTCEVCGPVMEQIKRQEAGEDPADPLTKDQEIGPPQLDSQLSLPGSSNGNFGQQGLADQQQLQQLQVAQMKLQNQLQVLKQLQRQQEQLLQQQRVLQEQQSHIKDPNTQQGQLLQQQQALLQQLQQRCQQQQVVLQQELTMQTNAINKAQNQANQSPQNANKSAPSGKEAGSTTQKKASTTRKNARGQKSIRGRGGKDKGDSSKTSAAAVKQEGASEGTGSQAKKRNAVSAKLGSGIAMVEPGRKMIKVEPNRTNDAESSQQGTGDSKNNNSSEQGSPDNVESSKEEEANKGLSESKNQFSGMSKEEIEKHLNALESPADLTPEMVTEKCLPLMNNLMEDSFGWVFRDAVDPVVLGLPDYFEVVKKPMHLELVKTNLENNEYTDMDAFQRDARLVFENSILYNGESSEVGQLALSMMAGFAEKYESLVTSLVTAS